jgi:hypothetical protein
MGGGVSSSSVDKIDIELFKSLSGSNFHEEIFDAYKDADGFVSKSVVLDLQEVMEHIPRFEEAFMLFGLHLLIFFIIIYLLLFP